MKEKIIHFLKKPYPVSFNWSDNLLKAILFGLFIGLFLWYFKPFGFSRIPTVSLVCAIFGAITTTCILIGSVIIPQSLPRLLDEEHWTVGKEILHSFSITAFIGFSNGLYVINVFEIPPSRMPSILWDLQIATFTVGFLPVAISVLYEQNKLLKKNLQKAATLNQQLVHQPKSFQDTSDLSTTDLDERIDFHSENGKLEISTLPQNILFCKSGGNYIELHFLEEGTATMVLFRNTMKAVEQLLNSDHFFRCHRSYLVNITHIESFNGNARGYEIHLRNSTHIIPVSRSKTHQLESIFTN